MKQRKVICEYCNGIIENNDDLITCFLIYYVVAYHEKCFADHISNKEGLILPDMPLNGRLFNISTFIATTFAAVGLLFTTPTEFIFLIFLIPFLIRLNSYFTFVRMLMNYRYEYHIKLLI